MFQCGSVACFSLTVFQCASYSVPVFQRSDIGDQLRSMGVVISPSKAQASFNWQYMATAEYIHLC